MLHDSLIRTPYLVISFLVAGGVVWGAPQTWEWTRRLSLPRALLSLLLLALALVALATQEFNPFIYFIF
jgi:alginate O-acetyltransferase complex protein AlgI